MFVYYRGFNKKKKEKIRVVIEYLYEQKRKIQRQNNKTNEKMNEITCGKNDVNSPKKNYLFYVLFAYKFIVDITIKYKSQTIKFSISSCLVITVVTYVCM